MVTYTTQESNFTITPEGEYEFEITSAGEYTNPNTGKKSLQVDFKYLNPDTMEEMIHTDFVLLMVSTGDRFGVLSDLMRLVGFDPETEGGQFDEEKLIGKKGKMRIGHSTFEGKKKANVLSVSKKS